MQQTDGGLGVSVLLWGSGDCTSDLIVKSNGGRGHFPQQVLRVRGHGVCKRGEGFSENGEADLSQGSGFPTLPISGLSSRLTRMRKGFR